jgi:uncharacterized protein
MQYRPLGKLNWQPSALGFGCMRLPLVAGTTGHRDIDSHEAIRILRHAVDQGVNYIDTAYGYHGGQSEVIVGQALLDGYRQKTRVATKLPIWYVQSAADFDRLLDEQLARLQIDHVDFYLFHALNGDNWRNVVLKHDLLEKMENARKAGKIGHIGFSFHGEYDEFKEIIDGFAWEFCQIQYNYMDVANQAGKQGLQYAAARGVGVVVMEPLLGGRLANPPENVANVFSAAKPERSPVGWALQWLWNQPEVSLVLSGMSTMEQVQENLVLASQSGAGRFSESELSLIDRARAEFQGRKVIPCTGCGYCKPCPSGVDIPRNFEMYNNGIIYDRIRDARYAYAHYIAAEERASQCVQCHTCEEKCPQRIIISEWMPKVDEELSRT